MNTHVDQYPPSGPPASPSNVSGSLIPGGRSVLGGNGFAWIASAWTLFTKAPGIWIGTALILFALSIATSWVPLASTLLNPIFAGGVMLGCRSLERGEGLRIDHIFAGFQEKGSRLVLVGVITLVAYIIVFVICIVVTVVVIGATLLQGMSNEEALRELISPQGLQILAILLLLFLALVVPVSMAYWFAPALIVFHNLEPFDAMKQSFQGCARNVVPFLLYGLVLLGLFLLGSIPLLLGLLVVMPIFIASTYTSYKDIYLSEEASS